MRNVKHISLGALALFALVGLQACGNGSGSAATEGGTTSAGGGTAGNPAASGALAIDGSSTVFPIANAMGEDFGDANSGVKVTVNKSGTGSGMQKFTRGEIDIATASRPIEQGEIDALKKAGTDFIEIPIAYDGVSVIVNPANTAVDKLTPDELQKAWSAGSTVKTWADVHAGWPATPIKFNGPTDNHGTFEYFTEAIDKKKGDIRKDVQTNQEYNAIVQAVAADKDAIAYVGYNYYAENKDKVRAVPIDAGKGPVAPSEETIANGSYVPLSRPLFLYVSKKAYDSKPAVKQFVDFALGDSGMKDVTENHYIALPKDALDAVKAHVAAGKTGSVFVDAKPGATITEILAKETAAK